MASLFIIIQSNREYLGFHEKSIKRKEICNNVSIKEYTVWYLGKWRWVHGWEICNKHLQQNKELIESNGCLTNY